MRNALLFICTLLSFTAASGQTAAVKILQQSAGNITALKSLSYQYSFIDKNPFSQGDTTVGLMRSALVFNPDGSVKAMSEDMNIGNGQTLTRSIYRNDTSYTIDYRDSIYSFDKIADKSSISTDLLGYLRVITDALKKPGTITQKRDTTVDDLRCYGFFIRSYDTVTNSHHGYTYNYIYLNKSTLLPVYTKTLGQGIAEKGGYTLGLLNFYDVRHYSHYQINQQLTPNAFAFSLDGISIKNEHMLPEGVPAPELKLKDLDGQAVAPSQFKNKLLLLEFGATSCAANPLANPVLNRLSKKYGNADVAILSIYSTETAEQVKDYVAGNKLQFPVYMGTRTLVKAYKTTGTPQFYLVDKTGTIIKSIDGYSDDLEKDLTTEIDKRIQ